MAARYRIVEEIGRGAMGRVYRAHDNLLEREVALKELVVPDYLPREERDEVRERFRLEAKAAARLSHPHILTVHDILTAGDREFIVMEYLEGKTLREVLAERTLTPEELLGIAPMICDAIGYAHERGIIHRDIKPDNIFVLRNGNIKVADFGIAKMVKVGEMTQEGVIMGTPNYIAPELVRGDGYDHRVDVFSLGVTMYELLTGTRPFDAENDYRVIYRVATEDPPYLGQIREDLPLPLVRIIHRCLEKDPSRRYGDMGELKKDLMALREELGMGGKEEVFDKEKALERELEAARGVGEFDPVAYGSSGDYGFHRDRQWRELIARIYREEREESRLEGASETGPSPASPRRGGGGRTGAPPRARARGPVDYRSPADATPFPVPGIGGVPGAGARGAAALESRERPPAVEGEGTTFWSGILIAAGLLTAFSLVFPWIGEGLGAGKTYFGVKFPESMALAGLAAALILCDAFLLLGTGRAGGWSRAMKILSTASFLPLAIFLGLRVVMGVGYEKSAGLGAGSLVGGIGWGFWVALLGTVLAYWSVSRLVERTR